MEALAVVLEAAEEVGRGASVAIDRVIEGIDYMVGD